MRAYHCRCRRGEFLCPVAERLWRHANQVYDNIETGAATWEEYLDALAVYYDHYREQEENDAVLGSAS